MEISREEMLMKLGAARGKAPTAWRLVDIEMDKESPTFTYALNRKKLRRARRREGRYLLRTNLTENDPALLWQYYPSFRSLPLRKYFFGVNRAAGWRSSAGFLVASGCSGSRSGEFVV